MRYRELRRILQQIVLAGLPATAAGCVGAVIDTDGVDTVDRTFTVDTVEIQADPALQFQINSCRVDVYACTGLCTEMMSRHNLPCTLSECSVEFGESSVDINVSYEVSSSGSGCPIQDFRPAGLAPPDHPNARSATTAWQSRAAIDPEVRAAIARDEARHAALAWAVDRWARTKLDQVAYARIDAAREASALGLPDGPQARGLYARAFDSIWNGGRTCHA